VEVIPTAFSRKQTEETEQRGCRRRRWKPRINTDEHGFGTGGNREHRGAQKWWTKRQTTSTEANEVNEAFGGFNQRGLLPLSSGKGSKKMKQKDFTEGNEANAERSESFEF
jgi:hypothetical protein